MNEKTMDMFRTLTEFPSASGFERELRGWMKDKLSAYTDEFVQDRLGVYLVYYAGRNPVLKLW